MAIECIHDAALNHWPSATLSAKHLPVFRFGMNVGPNVRSLRPAVRLRLMPFATNDSTESETIFRLFEDSSRPGAI